MDRLLQIVRGCRKYDRRCQRLCYECYYGYALRIAFRYMDSYEEATQLTNDMFLTIFRNFSEAYIRVARQICLKPYLTQNTTTGDPNLR